jgi:uncharacterized phage protein (TIGR01671 family)
MKTIKFRAWDKNNKRFIKSGQLLLGNIVAWKNTKEFEVGATSDFELMQFTGLHDKNGKEVFEGDVLGGSYENTSVHFCDKCKSYQLSMEEYGCMACQGDVHWSEVVEDEKELEVIGNIYEQSHIKEEKVKEIPQFEGTREALDNIKI